MNVIMTKVKNIILLLLLVLTVTACNKEMATPYDNPFFYIHVNNSETVNIQYNRSGVVDYKVYLSSKSQFETINLQYAFEIGDGLKEGVDFEILSPSRSLIFSPGVIERTISIRWISHPLDASKNNTLTIKLLGNDKGINIGLPGPDKKQSSLKFIKI